MIKDVYEMKMLHLNAGEDVVLYGSKYNKTPSPADYLWKGEANQEIKLEAID